MIQKHPVSVFGLARSGCGLGLQTWPAGLPRIGSCRRDSSAEPKRAVEVPKPIRSSITSALPVGEGGRCSYSGNTCTVFGATGLFGTYFVNRFAKYGTQMVIPYRRDMYDCMHLKSAGELGQFYFMPYFLKDEEALRKAVKYSNMVVNFIGVTYETAQFSMHDVNVEAARKIARVCREMGVQRLVHFSALNASTEPEEYLIPGGSQFLKTKALGEIAVKEEFPNATIIRPSNAYCHEDNFITLYMSPWRRQLIVSLGLYNRGYGVYKAPVWASDVVSGTVNALLDPSTAGETYEFVGPYTYEFGNLLDWMYELNSRGKSQGYRREGVGIALQMKTLLNELLSRIFRYRPRWNWEYIDLVEARSDVLTGCKTLENLGVKPGPFEERSRTALELYDFAAVWRVSKEELVHPTPPIRYPHRVKPQHPAVPPAPFATNRSVGSMEAVY